VGTAGDGEPSTAATTASNITYLTQYATRDTHETLRSVLLLSNIYNWFTEGFDTRDLQEAKILLEELNQNL